MAQRVQPSSQGLKRPVPPPPGPPQLPQQGPQRSTPPPQGIQLMPKPAPPPLPPQAPPTPPKQAPPQQTPPQLPQLPQQAPPQQAPPQQAPPHVQQAPAPPAPPPPVPDTPDPKVSAAQQVFGSLIAFVLIIILVAVGKHQYDSIVADTKAIAHEIMALGSPGALCLNGSYNYVGESCTPISWGCANASYIEAVDFNNNGAISARRMLQAIADCSGMSAVYFSNCDLCKDWGVSVRSTKRLGGSTWELIPDPSSNLISGADVFNLTYHVEYNYQQNTTYTQIAFPTPPFTPPGPGTQGQPPSYNQFTWRLDTGDGYHFVWYEISLPESGGWACVNQNYLVDSTQSQYCFNTTGGWYLTAPYCTLYTCTEGVDNTQLSLYTAQIASIQTTGTSNAVNLYFKQLKATLTENLQQGLSTKSDSNFCILSVCADYGSAVAVYTGLLAATFTAGASFVWMLLVFIMTCIWT